MKITQGWYTKHIQLSKMEKQENQLRLHDGELQKFLTNLRVSFGLWKATDIIW